MAEKILFSVVAFVLFAYIFLFKLIKKNDTTYLAILIGQAIGILLNFVQILFDVLLGVVWEVIIYILAIIIPVIVLLLEAKGINFTEIVYVCISKIFLGLNKTKKAKNILLNLIAKYDKSYKGHKMIAEIYEKEGGMRKAIEEYVKALDIKKNDYKSYFKISQLLNNLDKKDEAIQMLKTLISKKPELYEANKLLGSLLLEKEKFKEAVHIYAQAIKHNPDKADLYYNLGVAYCRINEFSLAKDCFEKTVEIDSNIYNAYYRLGQLSLLYRDIETAEKYFLQSIYGETESKAYYQLAKIYMMKNDKNKAATFLNRAIDSSSMYYDVAKEEPIFYPIKQLITPKEESLNNAMAESEQEKKISDYLDDTYNLTKYLNEKQQSNKQFKKFDK